MITNCEYSDCVSGHAGYDAARFCIFFLNLNLIPMTENLNREKRRTELSAVSSTAAHAFLKFVLKLCINLVDE